MTRSITAVHAALFAALLFAPASHAVMYKWTDETGSVTYSNAPPADPDKAREVMTLEVASPAPGRREKVPDAAGGIANDRAATPSPIGVTPAPAASSAAAPRASVRRRRAEAVRDPCLRSPDPQCHQRNQDKYDPYLGYAPSALAPSAVGAAPTAGAGGAVGGRITITPGR